MIDKNLSVLEIKYKSRNGSITIILDQFFPATLKSTKKLFDVIELARPDYWPGLKEQVIKFLDLYIKDRNNQLILVGKEYWRLQEKYLELQHQVDDKKFASGLPMNDEQYKTYKEDRNFYKKEASSYKREFNNIQKNIKKLEKNKEQINKLIGR